MLGFVAGNLANNVCVLLVLCAVDYLLIKPFVESRVTKMRAQQSARWFFVHSAANAALCMCALRSLVAVAADPTHAMDPDVFNDDSLFGTASRWPLTIINSVHVYHMIGGYTLTSADYFHHLLFIPTLGFPGQVFAWGGLANWQAFFISGLPGGVDYFLLGLQKVGVIDHLTEKRINANLNIWCRQPGILVSTVLGYQAYLLGRSQAPLWAMALQLILPPYNAQYYAKQATANYAVHYMLTLLGQDELIRERIQERTSKVTGESVMAWKDALAVPQRGS